MAACTPEQPEIPQEPDAPEIPVTPEPPVIDYGDGSKERPFVIDNATRLEDLMTIYMDAGQPTDKNKFKYYYHFQS